MTRLVERPIRHLLYPSVCEKFKARLGVREGNSLGIYSWEKNENRHERGTRWLCRWIGPLSRDEFNRKFCTGFPVSISFPRASTLPPSPFPSSRVYCRPFKVRISDFLEIFPRARKWKVPFRIYFNALRALCRWKPVAYFRGLWSRGTLFFLLSLFFILLLFFFLNTFCPRLVRENGAEM